MEEGLDLSNYDPAPGEPAVARVHDEKIPHARQARTCHGDLAIVGPSQGGGEERIE